MLNFLDFIFWHYYCFCERHKKRYWGDNASQAYYAFVLSQCWVISITLGLISTFVVSLDFLPQRYSELKVLFVLVFLPVGIYYDYRYTRKKSIVKNKYQCFREKWGDPQNNTRRNKKIVLYYTIVTLVIIPILCFVAGELNRRHMLDGLQLFPN